MDRTTTERGCPDLLQKAASTGEKQAGGEGECVEGSQRRSVLDGDTFF